MRVWGCSIERVLPELTVRPGANIVIAVWIASPNSIKHSRVVNTERPIYAGRISRKEKGSYAPWDCRRWRTRYCKERSHVYSRRYTRRYSWTVHIDIEELITRIMHLMNCFTE